MRRSSPRAVTTRAAQKWVAAPDRWLFGYDVFLSYARAGMSAYAEALERALVKRGLKVFLDRSGMDGGAELSETLQRSIRRSTVFVLLGTEQALDSKWVRKELEVATNLGRHVVPIDFGHFQVKQ